MKQNMTMENAKAGAQYATVDNAKKGYEGYQYADKKADEYGIDKQAVYSKVGNAALEGAKYTYEGAKKADWSSIWKDASEISSTVVDANKKEQAAKKY